MKATRHECELRTPEIEKNRPDQAIKYQSKQGDHKHDTLKGDKLQNHERYYSKEHNLANQALTMLYFNVGSSFLSIINLDAALPNLIDC